VLIKAVSGNRLTGLLTLARDKSGQLVGAGASQAEYQVWLATEANQHSFIKAALLKMRERFPGQEVRLKYVPGNTPLAWIASDRGWNKRCITRASKQPILRIEEATLTQELKKKNRREKINRLKRLGELTFARVTDSQEFSAIFDELASQYDFRKGAMFNRVFFQDDPLRKEFLLALFQQDLLHATVLKLNEEIIASNVGVTGKKWVHLQGINTHAPFYAKYSPGILHFLMMGLLLAEEKMEVFDLTPGADAYKDALATDIGVAYEFSYGSISTQIASNIKYRLLHQIKVHAHRVGVAPTALRKLKREVRLIKEKLLNIREQGLLSWVTGLFSPGGNQKKVKMYRVEPRTSGNPAAEALRINRGSLPDLLAFDQKGARQTRWEFLSEAMRRFEEGDRSYTWSEGGRLLGCAWLSGLQPPRNGNSQTEKGPGKAVVLEGFYTHPQGRNRWLPFLEAVAREVARDQAGENLIALVSAGDAATCQSLEILGFQETEKES
jgi:Acetyltransferase (GNAT) domain